MREPITVPVSLLLKKVKVVLNQNIDLTNVYITGEVSNLTKHRSGHYYFSLKDKVGEIRCVMFATYVRKINFQLEEGAQVVVTGQVNVYEQRGTLQLNVTSMKLEGIGNLYQEFEKRKIELARLGYFNQDHKKVKPSVIQNIGIITAPTAAALQDVLRTLQERWPMIKVTLYPALVQGTNAPKSIISSLLKADQNNHDAILVVRGGGSFEDLFCFNDVNLVKTIYQCQTYIVSGVGHEVDTTLTDLVADTRCVTPTAAAQWIVPNQKDVLQYLKKQNEQMNYLILSQIHKYKNHLEMIKKNPYLKNPENWIMDKQLTLDSYIQALEQNKINILNQSSQIKYYREKLVEKMNTRIEMLGKENSNKQILLKNSILSFQQTQQLHLQKNISLLDAYSPLKVLLRGYSITSSEQGIIRSIENVNNGDVLQTKLKDGIITSIVTSKE